MRAVVQRVAEARVEVGGRVIASIGRGLLVFLGIETEDEPHDCDYVCNKVPHLRLFDDDAGVMNRSVVDVGGSVLLVSQFTLCGDARRGRRPSYIKAAAPEAALPLYHRAVEQLSDLVPVQTGEFQAEMQVSLTNDGPVTILLDSKRFF